MKGFTCRVMDVAAVEDITNLWVDHSSTLEQFGIECAIAGIQGYKHGLRMAIFKSCIITTAIAAVALGVSNYIVKKEEKKKVNKE